MISRKLILIGKRGSGKTSLVRRLVLREFNKDYHSTLGVDIYTHTLAAADVGSSAGELRLMIWDTQGEIDKRIFGHPYFQGSAGVCIVSDVTNADALATMHELALCTEVEAPGKPCLLVTNKIDLLEAGQEPVWPAGFDPKRWPLFRTSAKDDINVTEAFLLAGRAIVRRGL